MKIRPATNADITSVTAIYQAIHALEERGEAHTGWKSDIYPIEATANAALARKDLYVCEDDGRIVASAIINQKQEDAYKGGNWEQKVPDDQVMVLHTLAVDPSAGGKGIGRQMVAFYEQYAVEHGCIVLRMDTNEINMRARSLYQRLGYREAGIVPCSFHGLKRIRLVLLEKKVPRSK